MNEEYFIIATECISLSVAALKCGLEYTNEREVFDSLIGSNQAIQHPLVKVYTHLLAAKKMVYVAVDVLGDVSRREACGRANAAKYLVAKAAFEAANAAIRPTVVRRRKGVRH